VISIVTISMNQGRFLPMAVESVLSQRDVDLKYVIVDAGSTDGSREYLATIQDPRVDLILEPDHGPAEGLNKGIRSSMGAVIGYLNADDLYLAGALRDVDRLLRTNRTIDVVYGDGWILDGDGRVIRHFESTRWGLRRYVYGAVSVLQQSTFFRREAFERTSGFNQENRTSWDGELLVDLALTGSRIEHRRADWGAFRLHPEGISGSRRLESRYREDRKRIFARAMGRGPNRADRILERLARATKLLLSPGYAIRRSIAKPNRASHILRGAEGFVVSNSFRS
jgi:glycosyltransferase involved in cell wall biosynthesis